MSQTNPDIAALIGSRICHDLISPVGAISNGLELMTLSGVEPGPEFSLVDESARGANARIRFFRVAFGKASGDQMVGTAELSGILDAVYTGPQKVDWQMSEPLPRPLARMVFLALLCLERAIPRGGVIRVKKEAQSLVLEAQSESFNMDEALWNTLRDGQPPADLAPAHVQFPLLWDYAQGSGTALGLDISETTARMTLSL